MLKTTWESAVCKDRLTAIPTPWSDSRSWEPALGQVLSPRSRADTVIDSLGKEPLHISCGDTKRNEVLCKDKEQLLKPLVRAGAQGMCALLRRAPDQVCARAAPSHILPTPAWCLAAEGTVLLAVSTQRLWRAGWSHSRWKGATNLVGRSVQSRLSLLVVSLLLREDDLQG